MARLSILRHCAREARDGLWRNPGLSLLAAVSIGVSLYVVGLFGILAWNLNRFIEALGRETQVQIYLRDTATPDDVESLRRELRTDPAVAALRYVSPDDAAERFRRTFPAIKDLPGELGDSPFPASFELELTEANRDIPSLARLAATYRGAPGVEDVRYDPGWVQRLGALVALVRRGGCALGTLLAFAALVTVATVVRLTVLARGEEIEVMKLVGATAGFIRGPFLLAAAVQGLAGGLIAIGALVLTHRLLEGSALYRSNPFLSIAAGAFLPPVAGVALALSGAVLGLIGAALSLRRAATY
jgi:cell division transport system permease protein